ncbi:MAG: lysylphosphatidylglycerol synthase transmembrane domain-containing protein [Terracidiphilus sp.]
MKKSQWILGLVVLAALAGLVVWGRGRIHFNFAVFRSQWELADRRGIAIALGCIYLGYVFRAVRWAALLRHIKKVPPFSLLGTQVIGFTAVALIGRFADPVRPYLVAKKTGLPLSNQIAVYIVERLFDAGSMALIFCSVMLLAPPGALPHAEVMKRISYGALVTTVAGALFLVAVRMAGETVASFAEGIFGTVSKGLGRAAGEKIRSFRSGLDILRSVADFALAAALSLFMWGLITLSYLEVTRAFVASPQLAHLTLAKCMLLMASSMAVSGFQLPILGWFSQIGLVAAAMSAFFGVAAEPATACAATLLAVTFLAIVPVGLVWAQLEHVSLRKIAQESERAEENLAAEEPAG